MKDKRRHKRFTLNVAEVNARMLFAAEVKVVDIGIGGISLKANRRLNIGNEYTLKLDDKNKVIPVKGAVVWSSLGGSKAGPAGEVVPIYIAGLKFASMSTERITELLHFIEGHKKEEVHVLEGTRLNVRFHLDDADKAVLNIPASYEVREVSLGGMLMECLQDFEIGSTIPMSLSLHDDERIKFLGRVASCRLMCGDGQKHYAIGIEFLDLTDKDKEALATFISSCTVIEDSNVKEEDANQALGESIPEISKEFIDQVEYFYKWHKTMGYYKVLSVAEWATDEQIKHAFLIMAKEFHPDKHPNGPQDVKEKIEVVFAYINEAYSTLMNAQRRKEYDRVPVSRLRH
jgi:Tfp pilus assembly protein PilZ